MTRFLFDETSLSAPTQNARHSIRKLKKKMSADEIPDFLLENRLDKSEWVDGSNDQISVAAHVVVFAKPPNGQTPLVLVV